jgi:hypothetical protein
MYVALRLRLGRFQVREDLFLRNGCSPRAAARTVLLDVAEVLFLRTKAL